jgi:type IV pilus assembly protein PilE
MAQRTPHRAAVRRSAGFSLIELLIATSVSGLLASVAYPGFTGSLHKVRRSEALVALMQVQQMQERFRGDGSRYGSLDEIGVAAAVAGGHYTLGVDSPSATGYVATAVAAGSQAADAACRYMRISVEAGAWTTASGTDAAAANDAAANRRCWNQ